MDVIINFINNLGKYIKDSATDITKTFTGADSGAVLVMLIFYLVILIVLILLLKIIVKIIKSFIKEFFSKKKKSSNNGDNKKDASASVSENSSVLSGQLFKDFNSQNYLSVLADKYNVFKDSDVSFEVFQHIPSSTPKLLAVDGMKKKIELSDVEIKEIASNFNNKNLIELQQMLKALTEEASTTEDKIALLNNSLTINCQSREKLIEDELSISKKHNSFVDELEITKSELDAIKTNLAVEYSQLFNFISDLDVQKQNLSEKVKKINEDIISIPDKIKDFTKICEEKLKELLLQSSQKETLINTLKDSFISINASRIKKDEEILKQQSDIDNLLKNKLLCEETIAVLKPKIEELMCIEAERKAREEAERREREEAEKAAKAEKERIEKEQLAKAEAERLERERVAKEEEERLEKERLAQKRAEIAAKFEAERKAREEAELLEKEKQQSVVKNSDIAVESGSSDNDSSFVDVNIVKEKVAKQAQSSYSLNFEDLPPELYEKIARGSQNRKINVMKAVEPLSVADKNTNETPIVEQNYGAIIATSDISDEEKIENDNNDVDASGNEDTTSTEKIDHMAELKKQWAAEKAHKEQFAAEQARKKAEEERRKKELLKGDFGKNNSDEQ